MEGMEEERSHFIIFENWMSVLSMLRDLSKENFTVMDNETDFKRAKTSEDFFWVHLSELQLKFGNLNFVIF